MGPRVLQGNRLDYNVNVQRSNNEELLVNLVRAKYLEPLFFLQVGSISSSFNFNVGANAQATLFEKSRPGVPGVTNTYSAQASAGYAENPTITYTPVQGEQAVKQLLEEITLDRFLLLTRAGWSIESLLWTIVLRIGELYNFDPQTSKGMGKPYLGFLELANIFGRMQERGDLELVAVGKEGKGILQLRYIDADEAAKVESLLGVKRERLTTPEGRIFSRITLTPVRDLVSGRGPQERDVEVPIKLKSCFEVLYDLSWSVEAPKSHMEKGLTTKAPVLPHELNALKGLHAGLVNVRSADSRPDAFVAIAYRGNWYYMPDDDVRSKAYFVLLGTLFALQAGELRTVVPLLTLPVK
jgi:hypothetical protein